MLLIIYSRIVTEFFGDAAIAVISFTRAAGRCVNGALRRCRSCRRQNGCLFFGGEKVEKSRRFGIACVLELRFLIVAASWLFAFLGGEMQYFATVCSRWIRELWWNRSVSSAKWHNWTLIKIICCFAIPFRDWRVGNRSDEFWNLSSHVRFYFIF